MTKEEIKHIVNNYYRKLKKQYKSIDPGFDAEAIHDFRVAFKKLRAFFRLVSDEKEEGIKVPKKLKEIYRVLGSIRDMQLQLKRIRDTVKQRSRKPQAYFTVLNNEIKRQQKELLDKYSQDIIGEAKKKTLTELPSKLSKNNFRDFTSKKESDNQAIIVSGNFSDDNLHSIRKNLKDIYYVEEIFNDKKKNHSSDNKKKDKGEDPAKEFLDKMGDFQDKRTGIALIKNPWLMHFSKTERELLIQIKHGWIKEKANMKRSLVRKLESPNLQLT